MILNADPKSENKIFLNKIKRKFANVIKSGKYILGNEVENFEKKFSNFIGSKYSVGVNSGTDALIIALKILGIKKGDEVIIPAISASATAIAVKNVGAKIIYSDIDLFNYNISEINLKRLISKKTKAIIVVHLHGLSSNIPAIKKIKQKNISISGPFSADTFFLKDNREKFDIAIGMYHDQVLTPIKTIYNFNAINITIGLPFIRISPDHGPNEKMRGKNISNPLSLIKAISFLDKN